MVLTSSAMFLSVMVPLPFDIATTVMRFWIRYRRKAWGADDWAMLITLPFYTVAMVATVAMSFSGVGAIDATSTPQQNINSLRWFYVFQEPWCFTLVTIKAAIGFALIRIANRKRWIELVIYLNILVCLGIIGGTGMYLFFQCSPVRKNWYTDTPGECRPREIQTGLSYAVAALSIITDWTFAIIPVCLLWNVQMNPKVKFSVIIMLSLGVFASIAPIVRLRFLFGLNDQSRFLENLSPILAWASAEMNVGLIVANLPACRPVLDSFISRLASSRGASRDRTLGAATSRGAGKTMDRYLELEERGNAGLETTIYGKRDRDSGSELDLDDGDSESQKGIVGLREQSSGPLRVQVKRDISVVTSPSEV
ncbi:uncharacterized protein CC84DRAFT_1081715 [Paraphaeosphaeria sporulosa]|uniref:Rhodopsin domain-containing protein n=1 Tax=Paraphaeosphaeria sporulosa TaxID=1460663 RepID=A0A177CQ48_9PLEO|nr:uncharacterized protein CC84DRAFT_1081715 [Paraphaeosphaeria sporulosa]OAG09643.1 hypothetical protein CC84DRAFT_1081715 [Paraphaeosphaeria sporulosa]